MNSIREKEKNENIIDVFIHSLDGAMHQRALFNETKKEIQELQMHNAKKKKKIMMMMVIMMCGPL